ncbi:MAG: GTP cyclohydrolase I FolE [Lachnospiraceae bacterium]|nr:GTP cyclohydrolase I FolE [Lachnospiraceae bacterium]
MDKSKIIEGVKLILEGIGEDLGREGLLETPERIARMYEEIFSGMADNPTQILSKRFQVENNQMIMEKDIPFYSMCEHHFLPFFGRVHIAYVPNGEVLGLSKLARCVELFAKRPQLQERMTAEICEAIMAEVKPQGVMVMVEADEHLCMTMRGIKKPGTKTVTTAVKGCFEKEYYLQDRFYQMLR